MEQRRRKVARMDPERRGMKKGSKRPKTSEDGPLTAGVPLAKIVARELIDAPDLVMLHSAKSIAAESFRRLKSRIANDERSSNQVMLVTSAAPSEGKTFVSMNLAMAFASGDEERTLIVDADMRRPALGRWLAPPPQIGLSEVLRGKTEIDHVTFELKDHPLSVLPAGEPARDSVELLSSKRMSQLMRDLRDRYDRVILDTPPIVPFTDADAIGRLCDGALLVARADQTSKQMFKQALLSITTTRLLGIVLNDTTLNLLNRNRYQERYYYHQYYERDRNS